MPLVTSADGMLSDSSGHYVGYFEAGSSHEVVQELLVAGQLKCTLKCLCSAVSCVHGPLQYFHLLR